MNNSDRLGDYEEGTQHLDGQYLAAKFQGVLSKAHLAHLKANFLF